MNATTIDDVETYIAEVRSRLADVPEEERVELLDDVAAHVREIAEEFGADRLHERLGTPEEFTKELRASAGYGAQADPGAQAPPSRLRRRFASLKAAVQTDANRELWRRLEPGWFVVRGVLFGYLVWSATGANNTLFKWALLVAGAVGSFRLGEHRPAMQATWVRRSRIVGEVALVVFALASFDSSSDRIVYYDSGPATFERDSCLRDAAGRPIGNLYAFDPSGQLIPQFFLTDQAGRPIQNLCPEQATRNGNPVGTEYARDVNGSPVYGVFPRTQTERSLTKPPTGEGITVEEKPVAPPAVVFPQLAPPTTVAPTQP